MLVTDETAWQRLLELLDDDDIDTLDALGLFRAERAAYRTEQANRARERALDSEYHIARIQTVPAYDAATGQQLGFRDVAGEVFNITARSMPQFAKDHGLNFEDVKAVCERRKHEIKRGKERYQAFPLVPLPDRPNALDRQQEQDEREADEREYKRHVAWLREQSLNKAKQQQQQAIPQVIKVR